MYQARMEIDQWRMKFEGKEFVRTRQDFHPLVASLIALEHRKRNQIAHQRLL